MLQKLNKKLSRNQKGFSLIELMVAVAILALVALGLFQAFTVAFQSMADSKDRTIATNYAQQILEDYKNIHFERIQPFSGPIADSKFYQTISVSTIEDNLKRVIAEISWDDRNNNEKSISSVTKIYNTQGFAEEGSVPTGIVIYADKYNLLPGSDDRSVPAHIYAEIIDNNGNLITDWNESNVSFEILSVIDFEGTPQDISYLGTLSNSSVAPNDGIADTYFNQYYEEEREGFVKIKVSLTIGDVILYDELTLKITNDSVAILLETDKEIISTVEGDDDTAHLTAKIVDAANEVVSTDREISFRHLLGPGNLTNFIPTSEGIAYIDLVSNSIAGVATITASSDLLEPGTIDIEIANPALHNIEVKASDQTIVQQGSTSITAMLTDYLGDPVSGETINFAIDNSELGDLSSTSETTDGDGNVSTTLTMNFAGTIVVTASWEAADGTIVSDTVSVLCRNHNLYVTADPLKISEGGSTIISAELTDASGNFIIGEIINFSILEGNGYFNNNSSDTTDQLGVASVTLNIDSAGTTTVEANWQGDPTVVVGSVEVICASAPIYQVNLTADKTTISVGETLYIKATVTENGNPAYGIDVTFSLNDYSKAEIDNQSTSITKTTDENGEASVELSGLAAGDSVTVTAEAGGDSDSINISCEAPPITIELINNSQKHGTGNDGKKQVYFNINVLNSNVDLEQIKIAWQSSENDSERLKDLLINDTKVYSNDPGAANGTVITFNQPNCNYFTLEKNKTYEIKMIFDEEVKKKNWTIAFINPETLNEITTNITFYLN